MDDILNVISVDERKHMLVDYDNSQYQLFVATWGSIGTPSGVEIECATRELHNTIKKHNKIPIGDIVNKTYNPDEFRRLSEDMSAHSGITHYGAVFQFGKNIEKNKG